MNSMITGHNPYFTGNSFAIPRDHQKQYKTGIGHNPYFTGNSFAIVAKFSSFYHFNALEPVIFHLSVGIKKIPYYI